MLSRDRNSRAKNQSCKINSLSALPRAFGASSTFLVKSPGTKVTKIRNAQPEAGAVLTP
jgi:hypothetical protein